MCSQNQMHTVHTCIQCTEHSVVVVDRFYISQSYTFEQRERERERDQQLSSNIIHASVGLKVAFPMAIQNRKLAAPLFIASIHGAEFMCPPPSNPWHDQHYDLCGRVPGTGGEVLNRTRTLKVSPIVWPVHQNVGNDDAL